MSAHHTRCFRVLGSSCASSRSSQNHTGLLGFATRSQARHDTRPNRLSLVRTDRLASGCSPPHLRGPRLLSPFGDAVTFGFQPVERLVERDLTSFSGALSGARARASRRLTSGRLRPRAGVLATTEATKRRASALHGVSSLPAARPTGKRTRFAPAAFPPPAGEDARASAGGDARAPLRAARSRSRRGAPVAWQHAIGRSPLT
jgi:hypothetical protein